MAGSDAERYEAVIAELRAGLAERDARIEALSAQVAQLGKLLDIEFVFRYYAAIRGSGHGRQHGAKACIAAEYFQNHESLMRSGRGS